REVIYGQRKQVLEGADMRAYIQGMVHTLIEDAVKLHTGRGELAEEWDLEGLGAYLERHCIPKGWFATHHADVVQMDRATLQTRLTEEAEAFYCLREATLAEAGLDMRELERVVLLTCVDSRWMDHIDAMDRLRDGIGLRAYGQKDPVVEFKFEGFEMFDEMVRLIREDTLLRLYHAQVQRPPERRQVAEPIDAKLAGAQEEKPKATAEKVGRNAPCPCGSGKKYKHCCGKES
ncbi:MAG: SEC-C metal-binding domain-containing protein, partial [Clostridia bacterium]